MIKKGVNYDQIAPDYDQRFATDEPLKLNRGEALLHLVQTLNAEHILEVGCGTGHWLAKIGSLAQELHGLEPSSGMLKQAQNRNIPLKLSQGYAENLPFTANFFDMVFCVNAIHHFAAPQAFIAEADRVLRPGGVLAVVGMEPHSRKDSWYAYHYFAGTYETDLKRFPR